MTPEVLLDCVQSFSKIIGAQYAIHLGRAGKHVVFKIVIEKEDCHHLMGLHYLTDRPDRRNRGKIFDDILLSESYRNWIASSDLWTQELENRVACTNLLENILDDNRTIIKYNPKRLLFYTKLQAEYLFANIDYPITQEITSDVYLFIDKRDASEDRFCKSVFPRSNNNYMEYQAKWQLLYKQKQLPDGTSLELYHHHGYENTGICG